jgi:hypothetical protein
MCVCVFIFNLNSYTLTQCLRGEGPEHGERAGPALLAEPAVVGELSVRHAHVHLHMCVCVCVCVCMYRERLGGMEGGGGREGGIEGERDRY